MENKRLIKQGEKVNIYTELTKLEDELIMVREMLKSTSTIPTQQGLVQISDYTGEKRKFLTERLYDLIYSEEQIDQKEEEHKLKPDYITKTSENKKQ